MAGGTTNSTGQAAIDRALLYSQTLPAHDRAVITAYRFFLLGQNAASRNIYQQLLAKNPEMPTPGTAWVMPGSTTHKAPWTCTIPNRCTAFRRTLALAPDYSLAYEHVQFMLNVASRPIVCSW